MKPMNCVKEKKCANAFVKIFALSAESFQFLAFRQQFFQRGALAKRIQRLVARSRVCGADDLARTDDHSSPPGSPLSASISTRLDSTSSRSRPSNASANCAVNNPYFA